MPHRQPHQGLFASLWLCLWAVVALCSASAQASLTIGEPDLHQAAGLVQPKLAEDGCFYLRARWMDPNTGRFVSEDPYEGDPNGPVSLHRFLYANGSAVSMTDPTGQFSLAEMSVANSISSILNEMQINIAFNFFDLAQNPNAAMNNAAMGAAIGVGGFAGFKLLSVLSKSFRALSAAAKFERYVKVAVADLPLVRPRDPKVLGPAIGMLKVGVDNIKSLQPGDVYIYVVNEFDEFVVAVRGSASVGQKHTQLTASGPAKAAGEFMVTKEGQVVVNNWTGRYVRQAEGAIDRVCSIFDVLGLKAEKVVGSGFP